MVLATWGLFEFQASSSIGFGLMSSAVVHGNQSHCELIITSTDAGAHHGVWLPASSIPQLGLLEK